jgi:hypothetical protein
LKKRDIGFLSFIYSTTLNGKQRGAKRLRLLRIGIESFMLFDIIRLWPLA